MVCWSHNEQPSWSWDRGGGVPLAARSRWEDVSSRWEFGWGGGDLEILSLRDMERGNSFIRTQAARGCGVSCPQPQPSVSGQLFLVCGYIVPLRPSWATEWGRFLKQNKAGKQIKPQPERGTSLTSKALCRTSYVISGILCKMMAKRH